MVHIKDRSIPRVAPVATRKSRLRYQAFVDYPTQQRHSSNGLPSNCWESQRIPYRVKILIGTIPCLLELLEFVARVAPDFAELFVDEGNNHGKDGVLCTIQVTFGTTNTTTFILDVKALGESLFNTAGEGGISIKGILEDPAIFKFFFDVREDSAALFHQYGVRLQGVVDIQIVGLVVQQNGTYRVWGLNPCIERYLGLGGTESREWSNIKREGRDHCGDDYCEGDKAQSYRQRAKSSIRCSADKLSRAIPTTLLKVGMFMPHLYGLFLSYIDGSPRMMHKARVESAKRVLESQ
ncbi:hypothetical protein IFR05_004976 [Cadophora sp. M221]|nr:hypothetical protein IFR05_004976 [Cadophora sp. M221]